MSINVCIICNERENISIMKIFSSSTRCCVFYQVLVMGNCRYSGQSENASKMLTTNENPASATHFPSLTFLDNYLSTSASIDWKWNVVQGKWYSIQIKTSDWSLPSLLTPYWSITGWWNPWEKASHWKLWC